MPPTGRSAITRPQRKPRRQYHHGNLRRALIDEALATIRTDGVEGLTLRGIGSRLGVSRTALYRHFADKQALLTAVATEGFRLLRQELAAAWQGGANGRASFDAMGTAYVRFAQANPAHYRVMFGGFVMTGACAPELAAEASGTFAALVDAIVVLHLGERARHCDAGDRRPVAGTGRGRHADAVRADATHDRCRRVTADTTNGPGMTPWPL